MAARDIIVIGASSGGGEALLDLVAGLPKDFPGAILVVIHSSPGGSNQWPQSLERVGRLPAAHAADGEPICPGRIYVAPPNRHLLVKKGHLKLTRGPRENHFRPAIDPLFRTAARSHGARVIGVVLSGRLNDGTNGLLLIKRLGGIAVIQTPEDALLPQMPLSALQHVNVDYVLSVARMPALLAKLATETVSQEESEPECNDSEADVAEQGDWALQTHKFAGAPSSLTCPDCGGTLWQVDEENLIRFRCHLGHAFTAEGLLAQQDERVETSLWTALRDLEEAAEFRRCMALRARQGMTRLTQEHDLQVQEFESRASVIRGLLLRDNGNE
jgi:two-component system chemotaxis response regulator CheB